METVTPEDRRSRRIRRHRAKAARITALAAAVCALLAGGIAYAHAGGESAPSAGTGAEATALPAGRYGFDLGDTRVTVIPAGQDGPASQDGASPSAVRLVAIDADAANVTAGYTLQLTASILPADAADGSVEWSSSDPTVATVDAGGTVTGVAAGAADITARAASGASCTLTVTVGQPTAWDLLSPDLKRSSYGFYVWRSVYAEDATERETAADAARILTDSALPETKLTGQTGSTTSLANFHKAARALIRVNEFRDALADEPCRLDLEEGDGRVCQDAGARLVHFRASDTYFAIAQVNGDYSDTIMDHARHHGQTYPTEYPTRTSEVIAWNKDRLDNNEMPTGMSQWYSEKYDYDNDTGEEIGHYTTLTDKVGRDKYIQYTVAGFSFSTTGTMGGESTELLECEPAWEKYDGYTQTAEEYLADVEAYMALVGA